MRLDGIKRAGMMHPDDGYRWAGTQEQGGEERAVLDKMRERKIGKLWELL